MRVLLVSPIQTDAHIQNWGAPCLGLMRIDSYVKFHLENIDITIYDHQIDKYNIFEKFKGVNVDICGVSVLHYTLVETFIFIKKWKMEHPESLIVVGGNEAGVNYQDIFDNCPADIAVLLDGESALLDIIFWKMGRKTLDRVNGIVYRKYAKPIDENWLWEYWRNIDFSKYRYEEIWKQSAALYVNPPVEKINTVRLVTSSHCNRTCTFCSLATCHLNATGQVTRPVALRGWQIMELVHRIKKQLPTCKTLYFVTDDVFYPNKKYFHDFIDLYEKSGYDFRILIQASTFSLTEKEFKALARIKCKHISIGVENASSFIRKSLKKPQSDEKIENIIAWSKQYDIPVYFLIILITPETTIDDLKINYYRIKEWIKQGVQISIEPITYAYKGTPLYNTDYNFSWEFKEIGDRKIYKNPVYVLPKDKVVRDIALEFKQREKEFVKSWFSKLEHIHHFKGETGHILIELLGQILTERNYL